MKVDPSENFSYQAGRLVGSSLASVYKPPQEGRLPNTIMLSNGYMEFKVPAPTRFTDSKNCFIYYTYDPKTYLVVSWRSEGICLGQNYVN
jgi:hypothetical protein